MLRMAGVMVVFLPRRIIQIRLELSALWSSAGRRVDRPALCPGGLIRRVETTTAGKCAVDSPQMQQGPSRS